MDSYHTMKLMVWKRNTNVFPSVMTFWWRFSAMWRRVVSYRCTNNSEEPATAAAIFALEEHPALAMRPAPRPNHVISVRRPLRTLAQTVTHSMTLPFFFPL